MLRSGAVVEGSAQACRVGRAPAEQGVLALRGCGVERCEAMNHADYAAQMIARVDSHWEFDWLRLTTFDGMSVLMHGQPNHFYFVCYSASPADSGRHRCH